MTLHPAIGAALFVLAGSAGDPGDWVLLIEGHPPVCASTRDSCYEAMSAINATPQRLRWAEPGTPMRCEPAPGCRPAEELCIRGYSC